LQIKWGKWAKFYNSLVYLCGTESWIKKVVDRTRSRGDEMKCMGQTARYIWMGSKGNAKVLKQQKIQKPKWAKTFQNTKTNTI
jgi:NAD(P)H-flavin reductase